MGSSQSRNKNRKETNINKQKMAAAATKKKMLDSNMNRTPGANTFAYRDEQNNTQPADASPASQHQQGVSRYTITPSPPPRVPTPACARSHNSNSDWTFSRRRVISTTPKPWGASTVSGSDYDTAKDYDAMPEVGLGMDGVSPTPDDFTWLGAVAIFCQEELHQVEVLKTQPVS